MKSSTELISMAREIVQRELERSIEKGKQPSFYECVYIAYMEGLGDASGISSDTIRKAQDWHYVELEGVPDNDDFHLCLCQYNGFREIEKGWYDEENSEWVLEYKAEGYKCVVAWHRYPELE